MLKQHAATLGLDQTTFDACFAGNSKTARVQQDINSGTALGVEGVPAFYVGNEKIIGFRTTEQLSEIIDRHLGG